MNANHTKHTNHNQHQPYETHETTTTETTNLTTANHHTNHVVVICQQLERQCQHTNHTDSAPDPGAGSRAGKLFGRQTHTPTRQSGRRVPGEWLLLSNGR